MNQLRTTQSVAQERADELDLLVSRRHCPKDAAAAAHKTTMTTSAREERRRARKKRAFRWFGRLAAMGAAVLMSVLTLMVRVEGWCQAGKSRELKKKKMRLKFDDDDDDDDDDDGDDDE